MAKGSHEALKVGIVGAGIAGLTTAIALRQSGHDVELFEKSRFAREVGAAIHVTPNSSRILEHYNFDAEAANVSELTEIAELDALTMKTKTLMEFPDCRKTYGGPWQFFHRSDLHAGLLKAACEPVEGQSEPHAPARLQLQAQVIDVDSDGTIHFENGEKVTKDLVVIANGINSDLVAKVAGTPAVNVPTGLAMLRFLIPMEELIKEPTTKDFFNEKLTRFVSAKQGKNMFVGYPCRRGTVANCCVFHEDTVDWAENETSRPADKESLYKASVDFSPVLKSICDKAEEVSLWRLRTRPDPIKMLVNGRLALIGDAAHPMLPFLGQGGAMAIEDAGTLGVLMGSGVTASDVADRLQLFQELRSNRTCAMQILSNFNKDGMETVLQQADPYMEGVKLGHRGEVNDWCFRPDAMARAREALERHKQTGE